MLKRRGTHDPKVSDDEIRAMFLKHLQHIAAWLEKNACFEVLYVSYNEMLKNPRPQIDAVNRFLGSILNVAAMSEVVDQQLYRQRR
jgi:hypothetical protein